MLKEKFDKHFDAYRDCLYELVEVKAKLEAIHIALHGDME